MTKHTVDEAIGGFEPKTDNSVIELGLGEDHPRFNYGESCAATALRDVNALKEAQHMLNCGIYGDGTADPLSPAFRINIAKLLDKACAPTPAYTTQADIEAMANAIAAYIYESQGLETMCYSGVDDYVNREAHNYTGEAKAALSASRLPDELARLQGENERLRGALVTITNPPSRRYVSDEEIANSMIGIAMQALQERGCMTNERWFTLHMDKDKARSMTKEQYRAATSWLRQVAHIIRLRQNAPTFSGNMVFFPATEDVLPENFGKHKQPKGDV